MAKLTDEHLMQLISSAPPIGRPWPHGNNTMTPKAVTTKTGYGADCLSPNTKGNGRRTKSSVERATDMIAKAPNNLSGTLTSQL